MLELKIIRNLQEILFLMKKINFEIFLESIFLFHRIQLQQNISFKKDSKYFQKK